MINERRLETAVGTIMRLDQTSRHVTRVELQ
jgi:hypothetical protein